MKGTIDGVEVYMDDGALPAVTLSVTSVTDIARIAGARSTTMRIIATKEARRVLGTEFVDEVPRNIRPTLRIGEDDTALFEATVIPVKHSRDVIECVAVGGNAGWFEVAKNTHLRRHSFPSGSAATVGDINGSYFIYFPLTDFGAFAGQGSGYDVAQTQVRPAARIGRIISHILNAAGWTVKPMGVRAVRDWQNYLVLGPTDATTVMSLDTVVPGSRLSAPDWQQAWDDNGQQEPPSIGLVVVGSDPPLNYVSIHLNGSPAVYSAIPGWNGTWRGYRMAGDGVLRITGCRFPFIVTNPIGAGEEYRVAVWNETAGVYLSHLRYVTNGNEEEVDGYKCFDVVGDFPEMFVEANHELKLVYQRAPSANAQGAWDLFPSGGGQHVGSVRAEVPYTDNGLIMTNTVLRDVTLAEEITDLFTAQALVPHTYDRVIEVWADEEYFRRPRTDLKSRDWTDRIDHSNAPVRMPPQLPKSTELKWTQDGSDLNLKRLSETTDKAFANHRDVNDDALSNAYAATVKYSQTFSDKRFGGILMPVIRKNTNNEAAYDHAPRLLYASGFKSGDWKFDGSTRSTYPSAYFLLPSGVEQVPMAFGNPFILGGQQPVVAGNQWARRLNVMRTSRTLEAYFFIRDHELKDFDFGMPTLIDDGSGPSWWWVQEIKQHRFGKHQPTKCVLVSIPTAEVDTEEVIQPAITYPTQPFLCVGPGYVSFVVSSGGTGAVNLETNSGYFTVREPNGTLITVETGTSVDGFGAGAHCVWASDSEGNKVAGPSITNFGIGIGDFDEIILDGLENEPVYNITIIEADTLTTITIPAIAALTNLDINGNADLEEIVITDAGTLNDLQLSANALTEACVDAIAVEIASGSVSGGTLNMDGGTSSAPSATGAAAIATLEAPPNMSISGTGNANVDGDYDDDGTQNGKSRYLHASNGITEVYWTGAQWRILAVNAIFDSYDAVAQPWLATTWILVSGTGSLPTVNPPGRGWTVTTN